MDTDGQPPHLYCPNPDCPHREATGEAAEYRAGFTECADCGATLREQPVLDETEVLPAEEIPMSRLSALVDPALASVVESMLEEAGIRNSRRGEGVQDLFAGGRIGTGYNVLTGPATIYVESARLGEAQEILAAAEAGTPDSEE